ncbi:glutathione reductase (NADPH) [Loktanella ponticola]|uniref:Glutathione reductase n=1 Tax=Yoonia ponticola TaxID=1524255 RepID=A0A7W9EYE5_9RHOB|nr:glutathione-disulfide reductase [Yoonia ponticola]MBB5722723.1 glutathione reductase (NADPH) [Yoonia ponticola]
MAFDFDLFVIGGGSGGVRAGRVAAQNGAKVALAEEFRMGGTCVIRGCVPKKLMVFASQFSAAFVDAKEYGWDVGVKPTFGWMGFRTKLHAELERLEGIYRKLLDNNDVTIFDSRAVVKDAHTVVLNDGKEITAKTILVAVGGRPVVPDFEGSEHAITSNDIFLLDEMPNKILIVGGGYIASEFAGILNGLGVHVTQAYRGEQILRGFDNEARELIASGMVEKGVNLQLNTDVAKIDKVGEAFAVTFKDGAVHTFDQVMYATGRRPNTDGMGLEDVGVALGKSGQIVVDEYSATAVPSIYAVGDVTDRVQLTPVAIREGMAFVETVIKGNPTPVDHDLIPSAVFTQPEFGTIGLSEEDAAKQEAIEVYATTFKPMNHSFAGRDDRVMMKLVVSKATRKVLGVHIVADGAGEMIQMVGIAVKMGATKEEFDRTVAVHPTMSEELVTMKEPVRTT